MAQTTFTVRMDVDTKHDANRTPKSGTTKIEIEETPDE
jgi:hypothetical protein